MRKISVFFFVCILTVISFAQTPEEIVGKCVNALGGEEAVKKFSDYKARGEIKISMRGMELPGKLEAIRKGNRIWRRTEITFG
ncbi:MAG: hypothetical protein ACE5L7_11085, partial [Candidatus Aminicenantales bacterium]